MKKKIDFKKNVLSKNEDWALLNKQIFNKTNTLVLNFIGSPGSGKTTLLYKTINTLKNDFNISVIEGDVESDYDKVKIAETGIDVRLINTHGSCHLNAEQIHDIIKNMNLEKIDLIIIENIGNLICPAAYNLGEHEKIAVLSTSEGDEKPEKYPALFVKSSVCVISKIDIAEYVDFNVNKAVKRIKEVNYKIQIFPLSAKTNENFDEWIIFLKNEIDNCKKINPA